MKSQPEEEKGEIVDFEETALADAAGFDVTPSSWIPARSLQRCRS
jgi:hypothetical protein